MKGGFEADVTNTPMSFKGKHSMTNSHCSAVFCLLAGLAFSLCASELVGAELTWFQPQCDDSYISSRCDSIGMYDPCTGYECVPGTLFQWTRSASFSGGPNLEEPLVTDRPDFTEASVTVGRGVAQLEFGYTYSYNADGGESTRAHSFVEPLLRYGILAEWLEFRIALFPSEERTNSAGVVSLASGTEDLYTGFKLALTPQEGILPEMALITQMNISTGSGAFTSGKLEPGLNWIYAWEINDFISTAGSTQANRRFDDPDSAYLELAQSWTVAYSLTEELGSYTEWFALIPDGATTARTQHYFNGGFTYLINNNIQFDIRAGVGLSEAADDYFLGTGLSIRFP